MIANLNTRDASAVERAADKVNIWVIEMWHAGASVAEIEDAVQVAVRRASDRRVSVAIGEYVG